MKRSQAALVLVIVGIITLLFISQLPSLQFNYVFEEFFPKDDPELDVYQDFKDTFGEDNNYLLVGITNEPTILDEDFLKKINSLTASLESLPSTLEVRSVTNTKLPVLGPAGLFQVPILRFDKPDLYASDSTRLLRSPQFLNSLVSRDFKSVGILVRHIPVADKPAADSILNQIRDQVSSFPNAHLAGKIHAQDVFVTKMQTELLIFLSTSLLLIVIFLIAAYRSFWLTILPLIVVFLGAVWILGWMAFQEKSLDILMVLLPTIMFVVGMSDVVHILTKYLEQLRLRKTKFEALRITFREVGLATFLTSLTTAVGFFTLLTASIGPIQEFGLYTGIGVFMAFIVAFSVMPASLFLMKKPTVARHLEHRSRWYQTLNQCFAYLLRNKRKVVIVMTVITLLSLIGIQRIEINTYLIEDLPSDDPLKEDFQFFDDQFGGSRPFEVMLETADSSKSLFSPEILNEIEKFESYLASDYGVNYPASPASLVRTVNQAVNGGTPENYRFPENSREARRTDRYLNSFLKRNTNINLVTSDLSKGRLSGRIPDEGSAITLAKTEALREYVKDNIDTSLLSITVTGTSNLIDKNNMYLAKNMFQGLGIAFAVVALIAGILFRSFRIILITLIPNIIPLLMVAAVMGYFGITLKLSTSIVFTIAFGIAVDDTLHFISKLKLELQKGKPLIYALRRTYLSTGKAIVVTSIILSGGFLILLLSSFGGTFYTGLLISLTLCFALIIDLTLLPVLILLFYKPGKA